jgi:hypothetical protein
LPPPHAEIAANGTVIEQVKGILMIVYRIGAGRPSPKANRCRLSPRRATARPLRTSRRPLPL